MTVGAPSGEELRHRVEELLGAGERLDHAIWAARMAGQPTEGERFADDLRPGNVVPAIGLLQELDVLPGPRPNRRNAVGGPPGTTATWLDSTLPPTVVPQAVLALTDARLLMLTQTPPPPRRGRLRAIVAGGLSGGLRGAAEATRREGAQFLRDNPDLEKAVRGRTSVQPIRPLQLVWRAPRAILTRAETRPAGDVNQLGLTFTDGSWLIVEVPASGAAWAFVEAAQRT
jgi:hypothetical protein